MTARTITFVSHTHWAVRCNLGERELEPLTVDSRCEVQVSVGDREAMTLMVQFEVESRG
jgi:hypothetical protein